MKSRTRNWLIVLLLGVVGLGTAVWYGPGLVSEAYATYDWTRVEAGIVASEVDSVRRGSRGQRRTDWVVRLRYRYEVDGQTHTASRFRVAGDLGAATRTEAERLARAYRVGDRIPVWVDPADPSSAVVERGGVGKAWANLAFGVLLVGVAVYLYFTRLRKGSDAIEAPQSGTA